MHISAPLIHDGNHWLPEGSTIEVSDDGTVVAIHNTPTADTVFHEGVLSPGFINVHCHLELSHMKGVIPEHTGLIPFLKTVPVKRNDHTPDEKKLARTNGYNELIKNGVVAVGDIANTTDTLDVRAMDGLHFHTFVEALGFSPVNAAKSFGYALQSYEAFAHQPAKTRLLRQTMTPHAPYSVSADLFSMINTHNEGGIISIHNQEGEAENSFYRNKEGAILDLLQALNIDATPFKPTGLSSLRSYLEWLSASRPYVFVHNTYTSRQDVHYVKSHLREPYWCLCPNANLYIEQRLPDINMMIAEDLHLCLGTDSLASNHQLSIMAEMQAIKQHYPALEWGTLLKWATRNGAYALQMQEVVGNIEVGKKPGILQLTGLDDGDQVAVKRIV